MIMVNDRVLAVPVPVVWRSTLQSLQRYKRSREDEDDDEEEEEEVDDNKDGWTTAMTRTIIVVIGS